MNEAPAIPGAEDVIAWFGYWPTFHDAKVLSISLDRVKGCVVSIHAFERTAEVDRSGHYVLAKHATVVFRMEGFPADEGGITNTRIECFNHQNVLSGLAVNERPWGYELVLEGCFGVDATIVCTAISVTAGSWSWVSAWSCYDRRSTGMMPLPVESLTIYACLFSLRPVHRELEPIL